MLWMLFALLTQSGNSSTLGTTLHFTQIFLSKLTTFAWLSLVIFDDTHVYFRFSIISCRKMKLILKAIQNPDTEQSIDSL